MRRLNAVAQIYVSTYRFLAKKKAHTNPLALMQGGLYGAHVNRDDTIKPLLKSTTDSYGFTALDELQRLYNGKSLVKDRDFFYHYNPCIRESTIPIFE